MSKRQVLEQQKKILESIFSKFLPLSFSIKSKQINLSEESVQEIDNALKAVNVSNQYDIPLPHTTRDLATYGNVTKQIFTNKMDYLVASSASRLSKRSGSWSFKIVTWDKRKIENTVKKGKERLKCKSDKDRKVLDMFLEVTDDNVLTENFKHVKDTLKKYLPLFVHSGNQETEHIYRVQHELNKCLNNRKNIEEIDNRLEDLKNRKKMLQKEFNSIDSLILKTKQLFNDSSIGSQLISLEEEKYGFIKNNDLNKHIKLLSNFIHALCSGLEKQQLSIDYPQGELFALKEDLLSGPLEMNEYGRLVETLYRNHQIYSKQAWYKKATADNAEMIKKRLFKRENVEQFFKLRELNYKINKLTSSDSYKEYITNIDELLKNKDSLSDQQAIIETRIKTIERERYESVERYNEALELLKGLYGRK
ncbi:MAG: hypothetical protein ACXAEU_10370 [Candidatus Hodarchaeales archaeon]|jgi:hypothetical protein